MGAGSSARAAREPDVGKRGFSFPVLSQLLFEHGSLAAFLDPNRVILRVPFPAALLLISRQRASQKPEFGLHLRRIGHSIRDFLAKEFAIPLSKPVNRHLKRPF